jgi:hypothetical protein
MNYVTRYNMETKRWEYGYWLGRVFHIVCRYPNAA